jgi:hypothetical protein
MNSFCDNPIICFSFTVGNIISSLMCSLVHNASTHFVLQYLQVGPIMYCSHTIFEDATPELVRDFFWDFDFIESGITCSGTLKLWMSSLRMEP